MQSFRRVPMFVSLSTGCGADEAPEVLIDIARVIKHQHLGERRRAFVNGFSGLAATYACGSEIGVETKLFRTGMQRGEGTWRRHHNERPGYREFGAGDGP